MDTVKVGTRNSKLAMIQTNKVIDWLKVKHPHLKFEVVSMTTTGDRILETALAKIGEKNLFTKELELALADGRVDLLVHSLKDLPTTLPPGMVIGAVCKRDDARDAVVMHKNHDYKTLRELPDDSVVGTSSLRRGAQLKRLYPGLKFENIRGNLNTRLHMLDSKRDYDCIILAKAGLDRMNWQDRISSVLEPSDGCMYAVCQGAMAVECRENDDRIQSLLNCLQDYDSTIACVAERAFLKTLEGGCSVPIGVYTDLSHGQLTIHGSVYSIDGKQCLLKRCSTSITGEDEPLAKRSPTAADFDHAAYVSIVAPTVPVEHLRAAENVGIALANKLKAAGADDIVRAAKKTIENEILMQKAEKQAAIRNATNSVDTTATTAVVANGDAATETVTSATGDSNVNGEAAAAVMTR